ncbi:MAG: 4Fe-4S dicluster domain-containing protein [Chloroflexi bacterium]|nr:4Fe-4S dicluster domain-containing protein [Chloroflexota bacterium]
MQHSISAEKFGARGEAMAAAVEACVHCGFCLAACPTYAILQEEMDSPRGRIFLMKDVLEGALDLEEALEYVDRCLGCLACVSACPSGVEYGALLMPFRAWAEGERSRGAMEGLARRLVHETLPHPARFRAAARLGRLARPLQGLAPRAFEGMLALAPDALPEPRPLPEVFPAQGRRRARVALLAGCVQQVLRPEINWATLRVLARNGVEVVIPREQGCCGALAMHDGEEARALALARRQISVFPDDVDAVVVNAAGCGSGMKEYPLLFRGMPEEEAARALARKVVDVSVFLDELGLVEPRGLPEPLRVAYHDACHLAHAQGVREAPRRLLRAIPNVTLVELGDDLCCGSAGSYSLEQPEMARALGERKARRVLDAAPDALATGNIGCLVQIEMSLARLGGRAAVVHTVELLDWAYGGMDAGTKRP